MSDSEQSEHQSNESSVDQDEANLYEDGEVESSHSSGSLRRDEEYIQEAEEEEDYFSNVSSSLAQDQRDNAREYQETEENRAMRETMERMVSSAIPEENEASDEDIIVLSPEHPMLKSFHRSVNLHLQKQKKIILNDIRELNAKVKAKRSEADNNAENLYGLQQATTRQRAQLDLKSDNLALDTETRQELEKKVYELREQHKLEAANVLKAQNYEEILWHKLDERTEREQEARKKKEGEDLQLAVVRRASEKAQVDKKVLVEEKKKQDEFVYRLTCEVAELQSRLSQMDAQLQAKEKEKVRLQRATTSAADDLEAQSTEQHRLMQAWQRLLVSAQSKDQAHSKLQSQREAAEEEIRTLESKIEGYRKGGTQEMERNEHLTLCMRRLEGDKRLLEKQLLLEKQNIEDEQVQLDSINTMLKLTEDDLSKAVTVLRVRDDKKEALEKEIAVLNREQIRLEDKILDALNEQATQDKAVHHAIKSVEKMNKEIDELESQVAQKESSVASVGLEVQKQRFQEACTNQLVQQHQAAVTQAQEELAASQAELRQAQAELTSKQSALDRLNRRINSILAKTGGKEVSPVQSKIKEMEDDINKLTKETESLQKQLLRKEVVLMEQTQSQANFRKEIEESKKHITHLQHKSQMQKVTLEEAACQEATLQRKTKTELHALAMVDKEYAKLRETKETLEKENMFAFNDIIAARKDEEQQIEQLSSRLEELELERQRLQEALGDCQRQQVELEAKVTMAAETKQAIEKERSSSGEIAALKSEIHRMEVRLSQLKRTQERLTQDLDQCVLRRDAMVDSARARNTRVTSSNSSQIKTVRKLENLRHSNKQIKSKIQQYHSNKAAFTSLEEVIKELEEELTKKKKLIIQVQEPFLASDAKLESLATKKKQNLEQLVHEQKRCRGLSDAKEGRYKPSCRTEPALTTEAQRQRVMRANLLSVIESLRPDFPFLGPQLSAISALLKSIKIAYNTEPPAQEDSITQN